MEKFQELRGEARQKLKNADYLVTMTYPQIKDNKLLLAAAENLSQALNTSVLSVLYYERLFKRIPAFHEDPESALDSFVKTVMPRYPIDKNYIKLIAELNSLVKLHKESPVEFSRNDKFVIASESYRLMEISPGIMRDYLEKSKRFIQDIEIIVSKDESIFRRSG